MIVVDKNVENKKYCLICEIKLLFDFRVCFTLETRKGTEKYFFFIDKTIFFKKQKQKINKISNKNGITKEISIN